MTVVNDRVDFIQAAKYLGFLKQSFLVNHAVSSINRFL